MNTCKTCKWWGRPCGEVPTFRACEAPKLDASQQVGKEPPDGFGCFDGEPYNGSTFATGPDFRCIHWEKRP